MTPRHVKLRVFRYTPNEDQEPRYETYEVPYKGGLTLLEALEYIYENYEPIAFRRECRIFKCGSCAVMLNGKPVLACKKKIGEEELEKELTVEPLKGFPVVKDLVVDYKPLIMKWMKLRPFIERHEPIKDIPCKVRPTQYLEQKDYMRCINCYACNTVCEPFLEGKFAGPALMITLSRLALDDRDEADRVLEAISEGLHECTNCKKCCLLYTSPSPRDLSTSRMPSSA